MPFSLKASSPRTSRWLAIMRNVRRLLPPVVNTLVVSFSVVLIGLVVNSLAGYAFAMFRFQEKRCCSGSSC